MSPRPPAGLHESASGREAPRHARTTRWRPTAATASASTSVALPSPCMGEHSTRLPPASTKRASISQASAASVSRPHVRVPRPMEDTRSPLRPQNVVTMPPH